MEWAVATGLGGTPRQRGSGPAACKWWRRHVMSTVFPTPWGSGPEVTESPFGRRSFRIGMGTPVGPGCWPARDLGRPSVSGQLCGATPKVSGGHGLRRVDTPGPSKRTHQPCYPPPLRGPACLRAGRWIQRSGVWTLPRAHRGVPLRLPERCAVGESLASSSGQFKGHPDGGARMVRHWCRPRESWGPGPQGHEPAPKRKGGRRRGPWFAGYG